MGDKITIRRRDLVECFNILQEIEAVTHIKFTYALGKCLRKVKEETADYEATVQPSKEYRKYADKRNEILRELGSKDNEGKLINDPITGEVAVKDAKAFNEALAPLKKEYAAEIEKREEQIREYTEHLNEKIEFEPHWIQAEWLPPIKAVRYAYALDPFVKGDINILPVTDVKPEEKKPEGKP